MLNRSVGAEVTSVSIYPEKQLQVMFRRAGEVAISLASADYVGSEAFVTHFADGVVIVE